MQITRSGKVIEFDVDLKKIEEISNFKKRLGDKFPKFSVFLICYNASAHIEKTVARIPISCFDFIQEVFLFDDASPDQTIDVAQRLKDTTPWKDKFHCFRNPKNLGYGGNQKNGYHYAVKQGHDYVIMVHGDGQYAPEYIPDFIHKVLTDHSQVVFGSRMIHKKTALRGGMPLYKWLGNQVLTTFENIILGTKLSEFHSGYRMYSTDVLKRIPFEDNTNDFHFDTQIIIQCRALDAKMDEIPIQTFYGDEECNVNGFKYAKDVCLAVLDYRLHQLHVVRRGCYQVKHDFVYTRKQSPYSSHERILAMMQTPGKALDLGSSNGLLTQALKEKRISSVCVDLAPKEKVSPHIETYIQANLEDLSSIKFPREFDYIVLADVVEHIRNAPELLSHLAPFLKPDGKLIISVPNIAIWFYRISLLIGRFNYGPKGTLDETHVRFYTLDTLKQLVERNGYAIKKIEPTGLPFEVAFESVGKSRLLKLIDRSYYLLAKIWPRMFAYQFVVEAEITSL